MAVRFLAPVLFQCQPNLNKTKANPMICVESIDLSDASLPAGSFTLKNKRASKENN
jgi:hypothetical protein